MRVWATISVLLALLAAAVYVAYVGWNLIDVTMPMTGYVAMVLGIVFSVILGAGLMALMFYSSRHGFDDAPSEFYAAATASTNRHPSHRRGPLDSLDSGSTDLFFLFRSTETVSALSNVSLQPIPTPAISWGVYVSETRRIAPFFVLW